MTAPSLPRLLDRRKLAVELDITLCAAEPAQELRGRA